MISAALFPPPYFRCVCCFALPSEGPSSSPHTPNQFDAHTTDRLSLHCTALPSHPSNDDRPKQGQQQPPCSAHHPLAWLPASSGRHAAPVVRHPAQQGSRRSSRRRCAHVQRHPPGSLFHAQPHLPSAILGHGAPLSGGAAGGELRGHGRFARARVEQVQPRHHD